ncbi:MAG: hypothetical protein Q8L14_39375 [Myxococcales bacterium]|nr:hypothetical protein [Myxococcales bacterium]
MAARKRKVTKKKPARAATKKKTKQAAPKKRRAPKAARRAVAKVDPDATIQVPVAEVLGDIEETLALDRLREER